MSPLHVQLRHREVSATRTHAAALLLVHQRSKSELACCSSRVRPCQKLHLQMSAGGRTSPADGAPTGIAIDLSKGTGVDERASAVLASTLLARPDD